jgi:parallel beta-helix repeat protein
MLTLAFNVQPVKAGGTIYIRPDGSVDPPTAPIQRDGDVYTFTDNIYDSIVVQKDNITVDGNGYTLQGTKAFGSKGIELVDRVNVTLRNIRIKNFFYGIDLTNSSKNSIYGNTIEDIDQYGIGLTYPLSDSNRVYRNNIANCTNFAGIWIAGGSNNWIAENNITACEVGISHRGIASTPMNNKIIGNTITNSYYGIALASSNNTVSRNHIKTSTRYGIHLSYPSSNNIISGNKITDNIHGIYLEHSSHNYLNENVVVNNYFGIVLKTSNNNNVSLNEVTANEHTGITILGTWEFVPEGNKVFWNNITNNGYGIRVDLALRNSIYGNNIQANQWYGISLGRTSGNRIYHNNFLYNVRQAYADAYLGFAELFNAWDDGYPSGGNYWSDYNGTDFYTGPYQNETSSDGIGDTPYTIDAPPPPPDVEDPYIPQDRYPLVNPWTPTPPPENRPPDPPTLLWQAKVKLFDTETWLTDLPVGETIYEDTVAFLGEVSDPDGDQVKMQIELRRLDEYDGSFIGIPTHEGELLDSDGGAIIIVYGLSPGSYHWQARTIDEHGFVSDWVDFGDNDISEADFIASAETVFRPPYKPEYSWEDHYSYALLRGTAYSDAEVQPHVGEGFTQLEVSAFFEGQAEADASIVLGDSWTSKWSGTFYIGATFNLTGSIERCSFGLSKPIKFYILGFGLKASLWVYDHTTSTEIFYKERVIYEDEVNLGDIISWPINIPWPKSISYSDSQFVIQDLIEVKKDHKYSWNFGIKIWALLYVSGPAGGFVISSITSELIEVRITPILLPEPMPTTIIQNNMFIAAFSPTEILITDQEGRRVGFDASSQLEVNEIPGAWYSGRGTYPQFIRIPTPVLGDYELLLFGTDIGSYIVAIIGMGNLTGGFVYIGNITQGAVYSYSITVEETIIIPQPNPAGELEYLKNYIINLPSEEFVNNPDKRKKALGNKIDEVILKIEAGNYTDAINKLLYDIRTKMDGDSTAEDWIIDPITQFNLCVTIDHIIENIKILQENI